MALSAFAASPAQQAGSARILAPAAETRAIPEHIGTEQAAGVSPAVLGLGVAGGAAALSLQHAKRTKKSTRARKAKVVACARGGEADLRPCIPLEELRNSDVPKVGGKSASLGEMIGGLADAGVPVPGGFSTTAQAYKEFLLQDGLGDRINKVLEDQSIYTDVTKLQEVGKKVRQMVMDQPLQPEFEAELKTQWERVSKGNEGFQVAVRSSATAEDLPDASFAGQQETYLNVSGYENLKEKVHQCYASLFTDRAISYRHDKGFDHRQVQLCACVQKMVRSESAAAGVMFTLDTESGFRDVVFVTSAWGLGETVVGGTVNPDEFYVFKPTLEQGKNAVVTKNMGSKLVKMVYAKEGGSETIDTTAEERTTWSATDDEVTQLAKIAMKIEKHYGRPMDIEWCKDADDGQLYVVQARPETVASRQKKSVLETYSMEERGNVICEGRAVGGRIGSGKVNMLTSLDDMASFKKGDVLVADMTDPDWEPVMSKASAIITNRGGRTCHAAIIARELGIPAIVGSGDATEKLKTGDSVTVSCAEGDTGFVYDGELKFNRDVKDLDKLPELGFKIMMNVGNPSAAFEFGMIPNEGIGLARLEFVINNAIGIHPKALLNYDSIDADTKAVIDKKIKGYASPEEFYVSKIAEGVATLAASVYPKRIIVRLSDFKSNEYKSLIGGDNYEPDEENPMIGFRGCGRYADPAFEDCFALELKAMKRVREDMGMTNVELMIPFVRTLDMAADVLDILEKNGLKRGENGLKVNMMAELPSNVFLAEEFLEYFDGFSIGSNDLTQLTLGLDRDSGLVAQYFDEENPAVMKGLSMLIQAAKKKGKYVGICGQGPSDKPELAKWLMDEGIDSVSLNPDSVIPTWLFLGGSDDSPGVTPPATSGDADLRTCIPLEELRNSDVPKVGGKSASLGEMIGGLADAGVPVPGGFSTTAQAYKEFLVQDGLGDRINEALEDETIYTDVTKLQEVGKKVRQMVMDQPLQPEFEAELKRQWERVSKGNEGFQVAVRSSATAEDLPDASFAGQQETYLNVSGYENLKEKVHQCYASLFTDRAISYRHDKGFDHRQVQLCACVQKMVRSEEASAGVMFTLDTESGFTDVVFVTSAWGLGETVVGGTVNPDEFYVFKPTLEQGKNAVVSKTMGSKLVKMVYAKAGGSETIDTTAEERTNWSATDNEVTQLAKIAMKIEKHYGRPMDIEWCKDADDGQLYVVQARPETVASRQKKNVLETYSMEERGNVVCEGRAVGGRIGSGMVNMLTSLDDMASFKQGDVLVADMTDPDWEPVMSKASAIITNRGGRTCHAAIIARELGIPAIVGSGDATEKLKNGDSVTVSCAEGDTGFVYDGELKFNRDVKDLGKLPELGFKIMMNVGNPSAAFEFGMIPNEGIGLARLEFVINNAIGIHPKALLNYDSIDADTKAIIDKKIKGYASPEEFYVSKIAEGVATLAASVYPKRIIVRLSDFKSNEYKSLIGGDNYEPDEENPMIGFRGCGRYADPAFEDCFALELKAMKRVREDMGMTNVELMIPFVRTLDMAADVLDILKKNGLKRGENGLKVNMMAELPSNVFLAEEFLEYFDGFSIGSNDLTQLTLGLDRDSGLVAQYFDEENPAVMKGLSMLIQAAKKKGKYVGICGQGPSDKPELAKWLMDEGIDSVSLNPDSVIPTWLFLGGESTE